jgi:hypothetical protein
MISMAGSLTSDDDRIEHGLGVHVEDHSYDARLHGSEVRQHAGETNAPVWLLRFRVAQRCQRKRPEVIAEPRSILVPVDAIDEVNVWSPVVRAHLHVGIEPQRAPGVAGTRAACRDGRWLPFVVHPRSVATFV